MTTSVTDPPPIPKTGAAPGVEVSAGDHDGSGYSGLLLLAQAIQSLWQLRTGTPVCDTLDPAGGRLTDTGETLYYYPNPVWNGTGAGSTSPAQFFDIWFYVVRATASPTLTWTVDYNTSLDGGTTGEVNGGATTTGTWWQAVNGVEIDPQAIRETIDLTANTFSGGSSATSYIVAVAIVPFAQTTLPPGDSLGAGSDLVFIDDALIASEKALSTFILQYLARLLDDQRVRGGQVYCNAAELVRGDGALEEAGIIEIDGTEIPLTADTAIVTCRVDGSLGASPRIEIGDLASITPVTTPAVVSTSFAVTPGVSVKAVLRTRNVNVASIAIHYERGS